VPREDALDTSLGPQGWCQAVQQSQKISPHVFDFLWPAMLERLERAIEAESTRPGERPEYDGEWVELPLSAEKRGRPRLLFLITSRDVSDPNLRFRG
jgi:hypothetical protein